MNFSFTARFFWDTFGMNSLDEWAIALSENGFSADHNEEERWELEHLVECGFAISGTQG